ncbi:MAG: efflux RND transporter periplasmic adaptor subunit [Coriobacteriia bacterium]|nr:efflux RND transporter periplasmic adaptor subunit [Coriobacteriia bacterium]
MENEPAKTEDTALLGLDSDESEALVALKNLEEKRKQKRRSRNIKIGVAAGVVALAAVLFFSGALAPHEEEGEEVPETAVAMIDDFSTTISESGSLQPSSSVVVTPEVDGVIQEVLVTEGQHVEEGDVLVTMRSTELEKAVNEAAKGVDSAASDLSQAKSSVSSMQKAYKKAKKEYKKQAEKAEKMAAKARVKGENARQKAYDKAIAAIPKDATAKEKKELKAEAEKAGQDAYDKAYAAVPIPEVEPFDEASFAESISSAKEARSSAQKALDDAQGTYNEAVAELDKCTVRAPQAGTLLSLDAVAGAALGDGPENSSGSIAQIADVTKMRVNIEVNEIDISSIEVGQRAVVTFSAFPDLELEARVIDVGSTASGSEEGDFGGGGVVTFKVDLLIDKPDPRLKLGMTANVEIFTQDIKNALVVPASAITEDADGNMTVEVVTDEETFATETRKVKVSAQSTSEAVIKKGLKEGEVVLLSGMGDLLGDEGMEGDDLAVEDDEG